MRARTVNEVNQFQRRQKPLNSMGIGMDAQIDAFLKNQGVTTSVFEDPGVTLGLCATRNKISFVNYLLDSGIDIHSGDEHALRVCAWHQKYEMALYLIKRGANIQKAMEKAEANYESGTFRNLEYIQTLIKQ